MVGIVSCGGFVSCGGLAIDLKCREAYPLSGGVCEPGGEDGEWKEGLAGNWFWSSRERAVCVMAPLAVTAFLPILGSSQRIQGEACQRNQVIFLAERLKSSCEPVPAGSIQSLPRSPWVATAYR